MMEDMRKTSKGRHPGLCDNCGKPIEIRTFKLAGKPKTITLPCDCLIESIERKSVETARSGMKMILKSKGFYSGIMKNMDFNSYDKIRNESAFNKSYDYAKHVRSIEKNWLYLYGGYGLGKTHMAVSILKYIAMRHMIRVEMMNWAEYCESVQMSWNDPSLKEKTNIETYKNTDCLLIDDIDKQSAKEWSMDRLYVLIDHRYKYRYPTIITANRNLKDLLILWKTKEIEDRAKAIVSRVMGLLFKIIEFTGKDYRLG